jgi:hypothetical protein
MPDLDKNYLAGLYLDEITLDVMPQEYIDAALEVKLRYDACPPRSGYNCVQDRRVKGGFYYRKAPQGQGVNALPPSKMERALARSREQPTQRSGIGFLGKAAIGAGVAIGGLALTGALVNAGRSSEPYQEPARQKPEKAKTSYTAATVGVSAAAATVGAAVFGLGRKPQPQEVDETIKPQESAKPPQTTEEAQRGEGASEAAYDIAAIKEVASVPLISAMKAYENALAPKYVGKAGLGGLDLAQARAKAASYGKPEGDEDFVRVSDMEKGRPTKPTKASREETSANLQKIYDKLEEYGLDDSIEFRNTRSQARGRMGQELTSPSANPYTVTRGGVTTNFGEIRFTRSPKDIQKAIAEKIKSQAEPKERVREKPPEPPAIAEIPDWLKEGRVYGSKAGDRPDATPADDPNPDTVQVSLSEAKAQKEQAQGALAREIRRGASAADGFVNQSSLMNDKVLKGRLYGNDPATLIAEGIDEGRIQTKKVGRNTCVRDIEAIPLKDFIAEAKGLSDVKDLNGDRRVKDLNDALNYKSLKASNDDERAGVVELRAAIANIQEVKPEQRGGKEPPVSKPNGESGEGGGKRVRGEGSKTSNAAKNLKSQKPVEEESPIIPISDEQAIALTQKDLAERRARQERLSMSRSGVPTRPDNYISPKKAVEEEGKKLREQLAEEGDGIDVDAFNKKIKALRNNTVIEGQVDSDSKIRELTEEYEQSLAEKRSSLASARDKKSADAIRSEISKLQAEGKGAVTARKSEIYESFGIPPLLENEKKKPAAEKTPLETPTPKPTPESMSTTPITPVPKAASEENAAAVSKVSKKKTPPVREEENSSPTVIKPKVQDIARIEDVYNSQIKDAEAIGDKALKARAKQIAFEDRERAIAALSSPPEPSVAPAPPVSETPKSSRAKRQPVSVATNTPVEIPPVNLKTLQSNIDATKTAVAKLEKSLARMESGGDPYKSAIDIMGTKQEELDGITREKLMSKLKKAIAKNKERVAEMEKEGRDYIDSQTNKDAIATSEAYLSAYHETRDKYRRAG